MHILFRNGLQPSGHFNFNHLLRRRPKRAPIRTSASLFYITRASSDRAVRSSGRLSKSEMVDKIKLTSLVFGVAVNLLNIKFVVFSSPFSRTTKTTSNVLPLSSLLAAFYRAVEHHNGGRHC